MKLNKKYIIIIVVVVLILLLFLLLVQSPTDRVGRILRKNGYVNEKNSSLYSKQISNLNLEQFKDRLIFRSCDQFYDKSYSKFLKKWKKFRMLDGFSELIKSYQEIFDNFMKSHCRILRKVVALGQSQEKDENTCQYDCTDLFTFVTSSFR